MKNQTPDGAAADSSKLDYSAEQLWRNMLDALRYAITEGEESRLKAVGDITKFLRDGDGEHGIDNCIRWAVLHHAVAQTDETSDRLAPALLVRILTDMEKYLAFESLNPDRASDAQSHQTSTRLQDQGPTDE